MDEWDEFSDAETKAADPWEEFADAQATEKPKRRKGKGVLRKVDAAVRGAADMMMFGFADEVAAGGDALPALLPGGETYGDAYARNLEDQRAIDAEDKAEVPVSRGAGQVGGFVGGLATGAVLNVGRAIPNALRGGAALGNAARAAGAGAAYGGLAGAGNADGGVLERGQAAIPSALLGGVVGAAAVPVAGAIGMGVNALRSRGAAPLDRAANALRSRVDPVEARTRINALRDAGAEPTFASATDEAGRSYIRAAASRMTPAREAVQQRAEAATLNMPGRVSQQARRTISADPRAPREIAEGLAGTRRANADRNFGAVRGEEVSMPAETVQALRTGQGRAAIAEAARRERDPEVRAALNRLAQDALDDPSTQITVGMADRISRVLAGQAQAAARSGDNDLASTLGSLSRDIREPTASAVPGYRGALDEFAAESRVMEAAERGEDFLTRNTDEFVADVAGPGQPGNELARATARRAIERKAGENTSSAPGVARALAYAPEQQARNRALLGDDAAAMEAGMAAEARTLRDLQFVAPNTGSKTQVASQDAERVAGIASAVQTVAGGPNAWVAAVFNRLKTAGLSDADAQAVADLSTDPRTLDDLVARIERLEPGRGQWLVEVINQAGARDAGEMAVTGP